MLSGLSPQRDHEKGSSRGPFFVFGKRETAFIRPVPAHRPRQINALRKAGRRIPLRPPARLSFGGSLQHWLIAERLTPYLAAALKRVEHLTGGDALPSASSSHRPNGGGTAAGRAGFRDEAIRLRRPYMAAGPAPRMSCRVWLLTCSVQRDDLRMQQVQSFCDEPFMREFNLPAQLAHPEPRRRVVGATDHS